MSKELKFIASTALLLFFAMTVAQKALAFKRTTGAMERYLMPLRLAGGAFTGCAQGVGRAGLSAEACADGAWRGNIEAAEKELWGYLARNAAELGWGKLAAPARIIADHGRGGEGVLAGINQFAEKKGLFARFASKTGVARIPAILPKAALGSARLYGVASGRMLAGQGMLLLGQKTLDLKLAIQQLEVRNIKMDADAISQTKFIKSNPDIAREYSEMLRMEGPKAADRFLTKAMRRDGSSDESSGFDTSDSPSEWESGIPGGDNDELYQYAEGEASETLDEEEIRDTSIAELRDFMDERGSNIDEIQSQRDQIDRETMNRRHDTMHDLTDRLQRGVFNPSPYQGPGAPGSGYQDPRASGSGDFGSVGSGAGNRQAHPSCLQLADRIEGMLDYYCGNKESLGTKIAEVVRSADDQCDSWSEALGVYEVEDKEDEDEATTDYICEQLVSVMDTWETFGPRESQDMGMEDQKGSNEERPVHPADRPRRVSDRRSATRCLYEDKLLYMCYDACKEQFSVWSQTTGDYAAFHRCQGKCIEKKRSRCK